MVSSPIFARPRAVDLFCGAGGLSLGLTNAGFDIVAAVDNDRHAIETFRAGHPATRCLLADVRDVKGRELVPEGHQIDLVAGGPSCQGFSTHGKRWADDPRNFLFVEFLRLVDEIRPRFLLMENVKGLLLAKGGAFHREIIEIFMDLGYRVEGRVLNAADFGVPQLRHRVIYLGALEDAPPSLPEPTFFPADTVPGLLQPHRTVRDAIGDLPRLGDEHLDQPIAYASEPFTEYQRLMRADAKLVTWHTARRVSAHAMNLIRQIDEGRGLRSLPTEKLPKRFRRMRTISNGALRRDCTTLYHRLAWDRPAYTITCYFRNVSAGPFVHPEDNRALTCREAARLQSFPDEFEFCGAAVPRQIGNAVPPLLAEAVGRRLVETLNSKFARAA